MFTSLARISVPALADACQILMTEDGGVAYGIAVPATARGGSEGLAGARLLLEGRSDQLVTEHAVHTAIRSDALREERGYRGVLTHGWRAGRGPHRGAAALAHLLVQTAVAVIASERLAERLRDQRRIARNLQIALETNRDIGAATGILMATQHLDQAQTFELLRQASQHRHCKLRDIAADVVFTGTLDHPPPGAPASRPEFR